MKVKTYEKPKKKKNQNKLPSLVLLLCAYSFPILVSSVICYSSVALCLNGICMCMQMITHRDSVMIVEKRYLVP